MDNTIKSKNSYIYGIKINDEVVYIGKTSRPIEKRIYEHMKQGAHNAQLEEAMQNNEYEFVILYESHDVISDKDLCQIERALIENIKPKYNILGVVKPYNLYMPSYNEMFKVNKSMQGRKYRAFCDLDIDRLFSLVENIETSWLGMEDELRKKLGLTKEQLEVEYGPLNKFDSIWTHYGTKGFRIGTLAMLGYDTGCLRLPNLLELFEGTDRVGDFVRAQVIFTWSTEEQFKDKMIEMRKMMAKLEENKSDDRLLESLWVTYPYNVDYVYPTWKFDKDAYMKIIRDEVFYAIRADYEGWRIGYEEEQYAKWYAENIG